MPKVMLKRFLNFNAYLILFMLIIVLTFGIFISYFIKEYNYPYMSSKLRTIENNCQMVENYYQRKLIRNSLYLINSCILTDLTKQTKTYNSRKEFEQALINSVHTCSLNITSELPYTKIAIYSIKNKKYLYFNDKHPNLPFEHTRITQLKNEQKEFSTENNSNMSDLKEVVIDNKKYLLEWVIIPLEKIGFEYYINTPLTDLRYVLVGLTPKTLLNSVSPINEIKNTEQTIDERVRFLLWAIKAWMVTIFLVSVVIVIINIKFKAIYIEREG